MKKLIPGCLQNIIIIIINGASQLMPAVKSGRHFYLWYQIKVAEQVFAFMNNLSLP